MKYHVVTFGCRVNHADSLAIEHTLLRHGGQTSSVEDADVVVVNSCSVTASADQGTRQVVRRIARSNPQAQVIVTGCYATRRPDEVGQLARNVRVVRNDLKDGFEQVLDELGVASDGPGGAGDGPCGSALGPGVAGRTAFTLRVQTGCDEPCSYCIIPTTRGPGRSRPLTSVLAEVDRVVAAGYKEIAITGVHLGSYGRDLADGSVLVTLLERLALIPADVLFRISSLEPMDCTPEVVELVAHSPRLAPHFHLPLQHGDDRVLERMRRPYRAAAVRDLVSRIHQVMPWAAIGTDVIVGFPGETDEEFEATERLIADLPLSHVHVFPYSDRPGTEASRLPERVPGVSVRERARRLRECGADKSATFRSTQRGRRRRALTLDDGRSAVTDNYIKVSLDEPRPRNQWVEVLIA